MQSYIHMIVIIKFLVIKFTDAFLMVKFWRVLTCSLPTHREDQEAMLYYRVHMCVTPQRANSSCYVLLLHNCLYLHVWKCVQRRWLCSVCGVPSWWVDLHDWGGPQSLSCFNTSTGTQSTPCRYVGGVGCSGEMCIHTHTTTLVLSLSSGAH